MNFSRITIVRIHGRIIRLDYVKDSQFNKQDESTLQQGLKDLVTSNKVRLDFICISLGVVVLFATESPSYLLGGWPLKDIYGRFLIIRSAQWIAKWCNSVQRPCFMVNICKLYVSV